VLNLEAVCDEAFSYSNESELDTETVAASDKNNVPES
jgi:hypothetical protein